MTRLIALALIPLLGACVAGSQTPAPGTGASVAVPRAGARQPVPPPSRPRPVDTTGAFMSPRVMSLPGTDGVIGANAADLQRVFGPARLDVFEGDARKLQFSGEPCVLDIYLYPMRKGAEPAATYVDARRSSDGLDVDRASCIAALRRR
ncbi:hypothetical protein [Allopontixanthobacter sediminis]|uniref:Beta/Gamma crystallin n=1 Tax=Allopontixanthobacter sediminis TaxID=1689985 RepID=A0A845AYD4_9SPHN|nr:hypothetical protein [Allopontixanthobacter sediminis]MXP44513.1 hypothetical protein [Allopontixanthobacter sediminis]